MPFPLLLHKNPTFPTLKTELKSQEDKKLEEKAINKHNKTNPKSVALI